jgi:O-glycosyl hydrolase
MRSAVGMMRAAVVVMLAATSAVACSSSMSSTSRPGAVTVTTNPGPVATPTNLPVVRVGAAAKQTIAGFGASGAWWPIDLAHFPAGVQLSVAKMLFTSDGLALSGYRYNIGGGGAGVTTVDRAPKEFEDDAAGLYFLRAAAADGVPILTGFVNSAPPRFTTNGKACGGSLKPGMERAYGEYLAGVVKRLHDRDHITLQYVSPMNEPDDSFGGCGQEGMQVPVDQRAAVVQALGKALAQRAPYAKVIADETTADAILSTEAPQWLAVPGTAPYVAAIAHHTYDFPNDALRALLPPISAKFHKPTWMTEICCYKGSGGVASSFGANYDPTMTQGFWLADQIESDFTVAGDSAWYWWTALSPVLGCDPKADPACPTRVNTKGFNDGLLYYDEHGVADGVTKIFTTKRFDVLGQFSRYVRPGAVRHDVSGLPKGVRGMAFSTATGWTVVTWNEASTRAAFVLQLPGATKVLSGAITDARSTWGTVLGANLPTLTKSGSWIVDLPKASISTYTFSK